MSTITNKATGDYIFEGTSLNTVSNIVNITKVNSQLSIVKSCTPTSGTTGTVIHFTLALNALTNLTNVTITDTLAMYGFTFIPGTVKINNVVQAGFDPNAGMVINVLPTGTVNMTFDATIN